jgi:endonuclease/exonuclease/phosphatase family metal-dependent hydrolase
LAAYDEVRVWRGVLTDEQLAASAAAGPDATITSDVGGPRFVAPETGGPPATESRPDGLIKLMTYNIRYCYDETGTINPDHTAARIMAEDPDFCCINEVRDTEAHPEAMLLAKLTGMHKSFGGNLLLSKEAPLSSEVIELNMSTEGWGTRYCLICEFTNFCVAVTHLDTVRDSTCDNSLVQASNAVAFATMSAKFATYTKPVFLCGDWNTRPSSANMAVANEFLEILSPTNGVRTYHGNGSSSQILDYISVTKGDAADFIVSDAYVVEDRTTSDHAPVCIEFYRKAKDGDVAEWVNERMTTAGLTGTWSMPVAYDTRTSKAEIEDATFTPTNPSDGRRVTMTLTAEMSAANMEQSDPDSTAQAAIRLGTNGCFQVWTKAGNGEQGTGNGWVDVAADGVTPTNGVEYTFRVTFDYKAQTYSAEVKSADEWQPLLTPNSSTPPLTTHDFPLATRGSSISRVKFTGETTFTSLFGEWADKLRGLIIRLL